MFWDKNDAPSLNIEVLLEKNATVEEFLDEDDIIQECKSQKKNIVNYFTRPEVIRRLVELITTEPPEDLPMAQRFRHANVACEILILGLPSLDEKLLSDTDTLNLLYSYLENEPPLNPLLASFFSKTFSMLFTKKSDQDWFLYQQMCLQLLEYLKTQNNFLDLICKHFTTPVIPDLIMEMMRNVEGGQLRRSLYEWLNEERLVEKLIDIIGDPEQSDKHANVAEFLCDLIHQGRTMRQTEQDTDSFEPAFEGSNPILKNIESATTLLALFNVILQPNALESAIVSGIMVVLKIIKPVMVADERNSDRLKFLQDREKEVHDELLSTVIRVIEPQLKQFNELLRNPPKKPDIVISAAILSPPFGVTRLQICRLFAVLLQTNNEEIAKAICETDFLDILLSLFKQYCWNNFLHSEVEKCLHTIFYSALSNNSNTNNNSTHVSDGSQGKQSYLGDNFFDRIFINKLNASLEESNAASGDGNNLNTDNKTAGEGETQKDHTLKEGETAEQINVTKENNEADVTKVQADNLPSAIQTHVIVNCKLISKLIECWQTNREVESAERGRRLGYMGHLIKIFKHITNCISESEHIGALIESNLKDDAERDLWQSIVNTTDGDLTKAVNMQSKLLANCEACDYNISLDFLTDNDLSDAFNSLCVYTDSSDADVIFTLDYNTQHDEHDYDEDGDDNNDENDDHDDDRNNSIDNNDGKDKEQQRNNVKNALNLFQFGRTNEDDEDEDEENAAAGDGGLSIYPQPSSLLTSFTVTSNPWDTNDDFDVLKAASASVPWAADFPSDNFADFDAHFSSFSNDMGASLTATAGNESTGGDSFNNMQQLQQQQQQEEQFSNLTATASSTTSSEEYDNNANVEKSSWSGDFSSFQIPKKDTQYTSNFIDDYEDDEGMWTKPLGGSSTTTTTSTATVEQSQGETPTNETDESKASITNGPSQTQELSEDKPETALNQLNNSIEDNALITQTTPENITTLSAQHHNNEDSEDSKEINNDDIKTEQNTTPKHKLQTPENEDDDDDEETTKQLTNTATAPATAPETAATDDSTTVTTTT